MMAKLNFELSEGQRIVKNFLAFCISLILVAGSRTDIQMVTSILNQNERIGLTTQALINFFSMLTSFIWPQLLVHFFGYKRTLITVQVLFGCALVAYIFPAWYTLMPGN